MDYKDAYEKNLHQLVKIKLGLPVPHDSTSNERIIWKHLSIHLNRGDVDSALDKVNKVFRYL